MNVFMPCESIIESAQALDDARLRKQIIECKVLLEGAIAYQDGEVANGYFKHPVAQHYKDDPRFLLLYAIECCSEYKQRFNKNHSLYSYFIYSDVYNKIVKEMPNIKGIVLYAEGRKNTPECIRTTADDEVYDLFKQKLMKKWKADTEKGRPPKWTNRAMPEWAKGESNYENA
jgi:hypothetical protein